MTNLEDNEFGFKRVSPENWLKIDPVWGAFGAVAEQPDPNMALSMLEGTVALIGHLFS